MPASTTRFDNIELPMPAKFCDGHLAIMHVALKKAWCAETSAVPEAWTPENPSLNQCAVTATVVHDLFGGRVVWGEAITPSGEKIGHYWNEIEGVEIDFTRSQFPAGTMIPKAGRRKPDMEDAYDYVLSVEATRKRYELLRQRLFGEPAAISS